MHIIILNQELSKVYVEKDIFRTEINATRKLKSQTKKTSAHAFLFKKEGFSATRWQHDTSDALNLSPVYYTKKKSHALPFMA